MIKNNEPTFEEIAAAVELDSRIAREIMVECVRIESKFGKEAVRMSIDRISKRVHLKYGINLDELRYEPIADDF